jgi:hypothetical protein
MTEELRNRGERRQSRWSVAVWTIAALLLVVPLVVMQFTDEMNWDLADFTVFGAMLAVAAVTCELAVRMTRNSAYRAAVGVRLRQHSSSSG